MADLTPDDAVVEAVGDAIQKANAAGFEWFYVADEAIHAYRQAMREREVFSVPFFATEEMNNAGGEVLAEIFDLIKAGDRIGLTWAEIANGVWMKMVRETPDYRAMLSAVESTDGKGE